MTEKPGWYNAPGRWKAEATPYWDERGDDAFERARTLGKLVDERGGEMSWATKTFLKMQQVNSHIDALGFYGAGAAAQLAPDTAGGVAFEVATLGRGKLISGGVKGVVRVARALGHDTVRFSKVYRRLMDISKGYTGYEHNFDIPRLRKVDDAIRTLTSMRNPLAPQLREAVQQLQNATREALATTERLERARARAASPAGFRSGPIATPLAPLPTRVQERPVSTQRPTAWSRPTPTPKPFDWSSDAVPPVRLQSTFRPERPGQPGWGLAVERSEPFWKSTPIQRLEWMSRPGDSTVGMLSSWERRIADQRVARRWVDQSHDTWLQNRYRHDPVRLASEQLRWSQPTHTFDPFQGTTALLGQIGSRLESQRQNQQWLGRVNRQYGSQ